MSKIKYMEGNYVKHKKYPIIYQIEYFIGNTSIKVVDKHEDIYVDIDDIEPIPLTKKWLLKFGGMHEDEDVFIEYKKLIVRFYKETNDCEVFINSCFYCKVKHVHILQNIIHALTGEELICQ